MSMGKNYFLAIIFLLIGVVAVFKVECKIERNRAGAGAGDDGGGMLFKMMIKTAASDSPTSERGKAYFQYFKRIQVCYDRFQKCSQKFNAPFCAISGSNPGGFYAWAHQIADSIMKGTAKENISCSPEILQIFMSEM